MFNYIDEKENFKVTKFVKHIVILLFIILPVLFGSWFTVGTGQRGIVLRFNNVIRIAKPGLNFKIPYIESIEKMDVQTLKEQVETFAASKDLQTVTTAVALNYNINPEQIDTLFREIGIDYKARIIDPAILESIKASTANYTAEELVTKREQLREDILLLIKEKLSFRHITPTDISITNFKFSDAFDTAIEAKVTAEQNALAAKNKLEQVKYEADQRIAQAKGEAEAISIQAKAITQQGGAEYVKLQWIEAWKQGGALVPKVVSGSGAGFLMNLDINN